MNLLDGGSAILNSPSYDTYIFNDGLCFAMPKKSASPYGLGCPNLHHKLISHP
jgi:hypothetical protein